MCEASYTLDYFISYGIQLLNFADREEKLSSDFFLPHRHLFSKPFLSLSEASSAQCTVPQYQVSQDSRLATFRLKTG